MIGTTTTMTTASTVLLLLRMMMLAIRTDPVSAFALAFGVGQTCPGHRSCGLHRNQKSRSRFAFASHSSRYDNGRNGNAQHDYTMEAYSDPKLRPECRFTEEQIHVLIAKRLQCKKRRNFADADKILAALNASGIYLQDHKRKYRLDGANHFGRKPPYLRRGSTFGLGPDDLEAIAGLVEKRERYKRQKDYHLSDQITDTLKHRYGVRVNDKKREWSVVRGVSGPKTPVTAIATQTTPEPEDADAYVPTPLAPEDHPTHTMSDTLKDEIRAKLRERWIARTNKKYKEADRIRDELMEDYSLLIDDRTKEWRVVNWDDDSEHNDPFVKEAQLSQRSAFVQNRATKIVNDNYRDSYNDNYNDNYNSIEKSMEKSMENSFENSMENFFENSIENNTVENNTVENNTVENSVEKFVDNPPNNDNEYSEETASIEQPESEDESDTVATIAVASETEPPSERLSALTVVELKDKLRAEGLRVSGKKAELVDRLVSAGIIE